MVIYCQVLKKCEITKSAIGHVNNRDFQAGNKVQVKKGDYFLLRGKKNNNKMLGGSKQFEHNKINNNSYNNYTDVWY